MSPPPARASAGGRADVEAVLEFLRCPTPARWFEQAPDNLEILIIDHAHCEKKAASTALAMLYRYVDRPELLHRMSRLAREELRHFEQVHRIMTRLGIAYRHLTPSRYAGRLMSLVRTDEPGRLVDSLLVGAIVEARSCERFHGLARVLLAPGTPAAWHELAELYHGLLASEARHFHHYLTLARQCAHGGEGDGRGPNGGVEARLDVLLAAEAQLCSSPDVEFRFHSGPVAEG